MTAMFVLEVLSDRAGNVYLAFVVGAVVFSVLYVLLVRGVR